MIVLQIRNTYYENYIFKNKEVKTKKAKKQQQNDHDTNIY